MAKKRRALAIWLGGSLLAIGCTKTTPPPVVPTPTPPQVQVDTEAKAPEAGIDSVPPPFVVEPAEARLGPGDSGLQFEAGRIGPDGRVDRTRDVAWSVEPAGVAVIDASGYLRPIAAGRATVTAKDRDGSATLSSAIAVDRPADRPWSFADEINPRLTRLGCNTGGCHAKSEGQNGFHLSLFGYDSEGDYRSIVREAGGRRISRLDPLQSLFYLKAAGRLPHGGGLRIAPGSDDDRIIREWLAAGAPEQVGPEPGHLVALTVEPADLRLAGPSEQQLRVVASYSDGKTRDVTRLASYRSNDDATAELDSNGLARLLRRAEADLVVRFQTQVVSARISTVVNPGLDLDFASLPRANFIDDQILKRLSELRVPPSPIVGDSAFLRRVTLDLTGQQPSPADIRKFLDDPASGKRAKKIDELLASKDFLLFWEIKLGDLLQISRQRFPNGAGYYHEWISEQLSRNTPWDATVRELLTTLGNPNQKGNGAANYALDGPDAKSQAEQTAQRFLGLRLRCAQCHDHPFDVWTQDDYYGLAAFFAKTQPGPPMPGMMANRVNIQVNSDGVVEHPRTRQNAVPRLPGVGVVEMASDEDPRKALAAWMTDPKNPFFAKATANWAWAQLFGKGIADPPDDLSAANPPVHPELLGALADRFAESGFDLRDLIRTIANSQAYQRSSASVAGNEQDQRLFSHYVPRPLTAHQMADAIAQATGVRDRFSPGQDSKPIERRALEVYDPGTPSEILDAFGRCNRTNGCAAVASPSLSLRQALLLVGGTIVENKVSHLNGYLARALEYDAEPTDMIENLYLRTLCRKPTAEELAAWGPVFDGKSGTDLRDVAEDLFWALLNSREFAFNH